MSAKCKTCGAPVNLAPDGDPRYEQPRNWRAERAEAECARLLDLAKREIKLLCEVATEKLRDAGASVDPPEKTYRHIFKRLDDEAIRIVGRIA